MKKDLKRGWLFDQILLVGQIEAAMEHNDEQICNLYHDLDESGGEPKTVERITDELNANMEILGIDYENRVDLMNDMFEAIKQSDKHYWCQLKHRAMVYVKACENFHARGRNPRAGNAMRRAGRSLAYTCSLAFHMEVMDCLRCLSDSLSEQTEEKPRYTIAALTENKKPGKKGKKPVQL